jgi:methylenetetrahydrofolate dehydrogenase (NADP+)/methenyltetrahydrofolate cyclohydrolase
MIIDGKKIAQEIIERLKAMPRPEKIFAAILVGENPVSESFLRQKEKTAKELGIDFRVYKFPETIKNDDLRKEVGKIANLKKVGGVIVQLPLPEHLNKHYILNAIPREKDVDVLGERALGAFYNGRSVVLPAAVGTVEEILKATQKIRIHPLLPKATPRRVNDPNKSEILFDKIAVVGAGFLIGKPITVWLMNQKVKELAIFEKGSDLSELKNFDLVISGVGQAGLIKPAMLKPGAGVIDFGYTIIEMSNEQGVMSKTISGDFDSSLISHLSSLFFYTPTPNGTGPILVAKIFENFYRLN